MPSFDVVSEVDHHELSNALDQANREIGTRYDFKGSNAKIEHSGNSLTLEAESEFQVKQMQPILKEKMSKRGIDVQCLEFDDIVEMNRRARQQVTGKEGLDRDRGAGRAAACHRQETRRPAASHPDAQGCRSRRPAAVQQLPRLMRDLRPAAKFPARKMFISRKGAKAQSPQRIIWG